MIRLFLLFCCSALIFAFEPPCNTCKHYVSDVANPKLSLCNFYKNGIIHKREYLINYADFCRNEESFCGKKGRFFKSNNLDDSEEEIQMKIERLKNLCCGEIIDQQEIEEYEQIERDLLDIYQTIRKHNINKINKLSYEIYSILKYKLM